MTPLPVPSHRRAVRVTAVCVALLAGASLTGCSAPAPEASTPASVAPAPGPLAARGLGDLDGPGLVDRLEALPTDERPQDLYVSVRPDHLVVTADGEETTVPLPADEFYLSIAPYVDQTHECFHHSLTTCTGELGDEEVTVRVVDAADGTVLVDETTRTHPNGFVGFWLPAGIDVEVTVEGDEGTATGTTSTNADDPTCLTTLRLAA